jgi:hypothetical protein
MIDKPLPPPNEAAVFEAGYLAGTIRAVENASLHDHGNLVSGSGHPFAGRQVIAGLEEAFPTGPGRAPPP